MPCSCGHLTCLCGIPCPCSVEKCSCKECAKGIGQICILCNKLPLFEQLTLRKSIKVCTCFLTRSVINDSDLSPLAQPFVARSPPLNIGPGSELQDTSSTEPQVDYRFEPRLEPSSTEEIHVQNYYSNGADQTNAPYNESEEIHVQNYYTNLVGQTHEPPSESEKTHVLNYYTDIADQTHAPLNESEEIHVQSYYPNITDQTHAPLDEFELTDQTNAPYNESEEIQNYVQNYYTNLVGQTREPPNESEETHVLNYYTDIADQTLAPLNESEEIHVQSYYPNIADQTHAPLDEFELVLTHAQNMPKVEESVDLPQNEPIAGNNEQTEENRGSSSAFVPYDRSAMQMKLQELTSIWKKLTVSWLKQNPCPHLSDNLDKLVLTRKNI